MIKLFTEEEFKRAPKTELFKLQCLQCNKIFERSKHQIYIFCQYINNHGKEHYGSFCSISCQKLHNKPKNKLKCFNCGKEIERTDCQLKYSKTHFCNSSCGTSYKNKTNNPATIIKGTKKIVNCINCNCEISVSKFADKNECRCNLCKNKFYYNYSNNITRRIVKSKNNKTKIKKSNFKRGYHITWEGKSVYYQSSYELRYAIILDEQKIRYEMQKLSISYFDSSMGKQRKSIPDFFLPDTNEIIEIKSPYSLNICEMKDKVKAYTENGYGFRLLMCKEKICQNFIDETHLVL